MEDKGTRRASMPVISRNPKHSKTETDDQGEFSNYDTEIKNLQKTLKQLGIGRQSFGDGSLDARPKIYTNQDIVSKTSAANRQSRSRIPRSEAQTSEDFVPSHLVSPYLKHKTNGFLRVKDDIEDTGVVSPRSGLYRRRKSDPGRVNANLISTLQARSAGVSSDSSEDDEMMEARSPRARSPRRLFTSVPEDESYPLSHSQLAGRGSPRLRRRIQSKQLQSLNPSDDSPIGRRRDRSNSLPLPDRAILGFGEAAGAVFQPMGSDQIRSQLVKRTRCISIEESPLEEEMDETPPPARSGRRYSVPAIFVRPPVPEFVITKEP